MGKQCKQCQTLFFWAPKSLQMVTAVMKWQPTPVLLPGKFHGWRSLIGYSPWGCKESDTTERVYFTAFAKLRVNFSSS